MLVVEFFSHHYLPAVSGVNKVIGQPFLHIYITATIIPQINNYLVHTFTAKAAEDTIKVVRDPGSVAKERIENKVSCFFTSGSIHRVKHYRVLDIIVRV